MNNTTTETFDLIISTFAKHGPVFFTELDFGKPNEVINTKNGLATLNERASYTIPLPLGIKDEVEAFHIRSVVIKRLFGEIDLAANVFRAIHYEVPTIVTAPNAEVRYVVVNRVPVRVVLAGGVLGFEILYGWVNNDTHQS